MTTRRRWRASARPYGCSRPLVRCTTVCHEPTPPSTRTRRRHWRWSTCASASVCLSVCLSVSIALFVCCDLLASHHVCVCLSVSVAQFVRVLRSPCRLFRSCRLITVGNRAKRLEPQHGIIAAQYIHLLNGLCAFDELEREWPSFRSLVSFATHTRY